MVPTTSPVPRFPAWSAIPTTPASASRRKSSPPCARRTSVQPSSSQTFRATRWFCFSGGWQKPSRPTSPSRTPWCWPRSTRTVGRARASCSSRSATPRGCRSSPTSTAARPAHSRRTPTPRSCCHGTRCGDRCAWRAASSRSTAPRRRRTGGTRPYGSRLGSWASHQSEPVPDRAALDAAWAEAAARFPDGAPLPEFWGGYRIVPDRVEFWQGRPDRLHDRLVYVAGDGRGDRAGWTLQRLAP